MEPTAQERLAHVEGTLRRLTVRVERLERELTVAAARLATLAR